MSLILFHKDSKNKINASILTLSTSISIFLFWDPNIDINLFTNNVILIITTSSLIGSYLIMLEPEKYFYKFLEHRIDGLKRKSGGKTVTEVNRLYPSERIAKSPYLREYFIQFSSTLFFILTLAILSISALIKPIIIVGFTTSENQNSQNIIFSLAFVLSMVLIIANSRSIFHKELFVNAKLVSFYYSLNSYSLEKVV